MVRGYRPHPARLVLLPILWLWLVAVVTVGCDRSPAPSVFSPTATRAVTVRGQVYGGQQPITGASIQLYAAGSPTSGGVFGSGATPLLSPAVTTDNTGSFNITGLYTLPSAPSYFYIVSTGGSPGLGNPANFSIVLMAAIGGCTPASTLSSALFININEVTTAAAIMEFASGVQATPLMNVPSGEASAPVNIGAPSTNENDLRTAFANISTLVDISTGKVRPPVGSRGQMINTLADILAYCVNSNPASDTNCSTLFAAAKPDGQVGAGDTAQVAWYIAQNPAANTAALFALIPASPPFPALVSAPASFAVTAPTDLVACFAVLGTSAVSNTAASATVVSGGDLGISPTTGAAVTGFTFSTAPDTGVVMGSPATVHLTDAVAANAQTDVAQAIAYAAGLPNAGPLSLPTTVSTSTFTPGVYGNGAAVGFAANTTVTLDAMGDPDAVFIFQVGSALTTLGGSSIVLTNNAQARNVFWQLGTAATIGGSFVGTIMAGSAVTLGAGFPLQGRVFAGSAITLNDNAITAP